MPSYLETTKATAVPTHVRCMDRRSIALPSILDWIREDILRAAVLTQKTVRSKGCVRVASRYSRISSRTILAATRAGIPMMIVNCAGTKEAQHSHARPIIDSLSHLLAAEDQRTKKCLEKRVLLRAIKRIDQVPQSVLAEFLDVREDFEREAHRVATVI